eukprot:TRINITY_DN78726_c0_g1_i1.p1 TRINITY_DN78726_c0_g1~~TRINITY_DN78726_c0_g1_i1.p1  ORF type:complete len:299 (-),score=60.95 TRINITY_DN78726_c0_g1_i1:319-1143(-)
MSKTILITGATDGIGLETAKQLVALGHNVLIHGRNASKLSATHAQLSRIRGARAVETYRADLSVLSELKSMGDALCAKHASLDVLINNAGVYSTPQKLTAQRLDVRFVVNAIAPYVLTKRLLPIMSPQSRVVNLSSAAQQTVSLNALSGNTRLSDGAAYAQSKLALTMWSFHLAKAQCANGPSVIALNPGSFLGTKMVRDAYGVAGNDVRVGADILVRAACSEQFASASGRYFDNDRGKFASPHSDALDATKNEKLVQAIDSLLAAMESTTGDV